MITFTVNVKHIFFYKLAMYNLCDSLFKIKNKIRNQREIIFCIKLSCYLVIQMTTKINVSDGKLKYETKTKGKTQIQIKRSENRVLDIFRK